MPPAVALRPTAYLGDGFPMPDRCDRAFPTHRAEQADKSAAALCPGLFSKFRGPGGNSIVVISGTRDEGVQQTAEAFTCAG